MSLSATIQKAVNAGFRAAGDIPKAVKITTVGTGTYDAINDITTGTTTQTLTINGIVASFTSYEIASSYGSILFSDVKLICNSQDITIPVDTTSEFEIDGVVYKVANPANTGRSASGITTKAGDFIKTFQLRAF